MKAKLKVKKSNQYSCYNGNVYEVKNVYVCKGLKIYALIGVNDEYPNNTTDFSELELTIINN
jgi:hypothetical protein